MNIRNLNGLGAISAGLSVFTGCMHGETFAEWKGQLLESDPWTVAAVEPNDTQVDEANREFIQEVKTAMAQRDKFQREARVLPSQNVTAFLNSPREGGEGGESTSARRICGQDSRCLFNGEVTQDRRYRR